MSGPSTKHSDLKTPVQNFLSRIVWHLTIFNNEGRKVAGPEIFDTYQAANEAGMFMRDHAGYSHHEVCRAEERMWIQ